MTKVIIKFPYVLKPDVRKQKYEELKKQWESGLMVIDDCTQVIVLKDEDELMFQEGAKEIHCRTCKHKDRYPNCPGYGIDFEKWEAEDDLFKVIFDGKSAAEWFKHDVCTHCKHSYDDGCCGLGEPCSDFNRWEYKNND